MTQHRTVRLEEDPATGDLILPFSSDMLAQVGWDFGDTLIWEMDEAIGNWTIRKKDDSEQKSQP